MIGQKDWGDGRNTTKAQKADSMAITEVIYWRRVHFLTSLNLAEAMLSVGAGLFFNELEPCRNYPQG